MIQKSNDWWIPWHITKLRFVVKLQTDLPDKLTLTQLYHLKKPRGCQNWFYLAPNLWRGEIYNNVLWAKLCYKMWLPTRLILLETILCTLSRRHWLQQPGIKVELPGDCGWLQTQLDLPDARVSGPWCSIPNVASNSWVAERAISLCCFLSAPWHDQKIWWMK